MRAVRARPGLCLSLGEVQGRVPLGCWNSPPGSQGLRGLDLVAGEPGPRCGSRSPSRPAPPVTGAPRCGLARCLWEQHLLDGQ